MTRLKYLSLLACLSLSLTAIACGSSNTDNGGSGGATGAGGAAGGVSGGAGGAAATGWDQARIADSGTKWTINARKGAYFFYVTVGPSYNDTAADHTVRNMAISFTQKVVAKFKSGSPAPATFVPMISELPAVSGGSAWTLDPDQPYTASGPALASNENDATNFVDGGADVFFKDGFSAVGMAWENWVNGDYTIELQVWQLASSGDAVKLWTDMLSDSFYDLTFTACTGTDSSNPCPLP